MCPVHHLSKKSQRTKERLRLSTARLKSFIWRGDDQAPIEGFGFVADFSETGLGLYFGEKVAKGQQVRVALSSEGAESFRGNVIWCNRYSMEQNFVGHKALSYRVGIKLVFSSEAERQRYVAYFKSLQDQALVIRPGMIF